jgi:hypothetical protein
VFSRTIYLRGKTSLGRANTNPPGINPLQPFQAFQWFDGLTMSGFVLNHFASLKALRQFKYKVQEFNANFHVSGILETSKAC